MYRCYGNYNIAVINSEKGGKIAKNVKTTFISAFLSRYMLILLLLAAPTWLWGHCGRHNYPQASSVMDFVFRRSDGSHVSIDTVHPSLLLPGGTISRVFLPTYSWSRLFTWPNHLSLAFLHLSVCSLLSVSS